MSAEPLSVTVHLADDFDIVFTRRIVRWAGPDEPVTRAVVVALLRSMADALDEADA